MKIRVQSVSYWCLFVSVGLKCFFLHVIISNYTSFLQMSRFSSFSLDKTHYIFLKFLYLFVYVCVQVGVCMCMGTCGMTHMWWSNGNLWELGLSFHCTVLRNGTRVIRLGAKCLYLLSQPADPPSDLNIAGFDYHEHPFDSRY